MSHSFIKLRSGEWGVKLIEHQAQPGETLRIKRADGTEADVVVAKRIFGTDNIALWSVQDILPVMTEPASLPEATVSTCSDTKSSTPGEGLAKAEATPRALSPNTKEKTRRVSSLFFPTRRLVRKAGGKDGFPFQEVVDTLTAINQAQAPIDWKADPSSLVLEFPSGRAEAAWSVPLAHYGGETLYFTQIGWRQLASIVLPSRFGSGFEKLVRIDEEAENIAADVWRKFVSRVGKKLLFRSVRRKLDDGSVVRVIRSVHSTKYAAYGDRRLATAIQDALGIDNKLTALGWALGDTAMCLRLKAFDKTTAAFAAFDPTGQTLLNTPVPMVEAWNSEVGLRSISLEAGIYRQLTQTGVKVWSNRGRKRWIHRGNQNRIRQETRRAFTELSEQSAQLRDDYMAASLTGVPEYEKVIEVLGAKRGLTDKAIAAIKQNMSHPDITQGKTLASLVDAIGLTANGAEGMFESYELEETASLMLHVGMRYRGLNDEGNYVLHLESIQRWS